MPDEKPIGKIPLLTMQDVQLELQSLKSRVTELEAVRVRLSDEWQRERSDTLEAIKRYVGPTVTDLSTRFQRFEESQKQSLAILQESREWVKLGLDGRKIEVESRKADAVLHSDELKVAVDAKVRQRTALLVLFGVLATAAASIITAVATSNAH